MPVTYDIFKEVTPCIIANQLTGMESLRNNHLSMVSSVEFYRSMQQKSTTIMAVERIKRPDPAMFPYLDNLKIDIT